MSAYYGVKNGHKPGVYSTWMECKREITGFKKSNFKKFNNYEEAVAYVNTNTLSDFVDTSDTCSYCLDTFEKDLIYIECIKNCNLKIHQRCFFLRHSCLKPTAYLINNFVCYGCIHVGKVNEGRESTIIIDNHLDVLKSVLNSTDKIDETNIESLPNSTTLPQKSLIINDDIDLNLKRSTQELNMECCNQICNLDKIGRLKEDKLFLQQLFIAIIDRKSDLSYNKPQSENGCKNDTVLKENLNNDPISDGDLKLSNKLASDSKFYTNINNRPNIIEDGYLGTSDYYFPRKPVSLAFSGERTFYNSHKTRYHISNNAVSSNSPLILSNSSNKLYLRGLNFILSFEEISNRIRNILGENISFVCYSLKSRVYGNNSFCLEAKEDLISKLTGDSAFTKDIRIRLYRGDLNLRVVENRFSLEKISILI